MTKTTNVPNAKQAEEKKNAPVDPILSDIPPED
jgi:hypothetical protein